MRVSSIFQFYPPHPGTCLHWGIKPSQDQEPLLPLMSDKVILCYICSWNHGLVLSPWVLWTVWLVHIVVLPIRLQTPSAPSVLPLTAPLGTPWSVWLLAVSISLCSCQALAEPLRRQSYYAPISKHLLVSTIVTVPGFCIWDGSKGWTESGWSFLKSLPWSPHFLSGILCSPF